MRKLNPFLSRLHKFYCILLQKVNHRNSNMCWRLHTHKRKKKLKQETLHLNPWQLNVIVFIFRSGRVHNKVNTSQKRTYCMYLSLYIFENVLNFYPVTNLSTRIVSTYEVLFFEINKPFYRDLKISSKLNSVIYVKLFFILYFREHWET